MNLTLNSISMTKETLCGHRVIGLLPLVWHFLLIPCLHCCHTALEWSCLGFHSSLWLCSACTADGNSSPLCTCCCPCSHWPGCWMWDAGLEGAKFHWAFEIFPHRAPVPHTLGQFWMMSEHRRRYCSSWFLVLLLEEGGNLHNKYNMKKGTSGVVVKLTRLSLLNQGEWKVPVPSTNM